MSITALSETELSSLKESLLFQKSSILNKSHEFKSEQANSSLISDEVELASHDLATNISIHLHERDRQALYQIERALGKISEGIYGQCECCGELISPRRLQARPFTSLCIECMEEQEDSRGPVQ
ncbi:MAG: TraR/DksA family transcriptional regulator [Bdellovibrionia bacterium]